MTTRIYALETWTDSNGSFTANQTYTLTDGQANVYIQQGRAQLLDRLQQYGQTELPQGAHLVTSNTDASGQSNLTIGSQKITGFSTLLDKIRQGLAKNSAKPYKTNFLQAPKPWSSSPAGLAIVGTAGQFSASAGTFNVGQEVTITGTLGGTGSITGYATNTTYRISVTDGSTTFTLVTLEGAAIVTSIGTLTGLTYATNYTPATCVLANGAWYNCLTGGASGTAAPTWTTTPQTVAPFSRITDGSCTWVYRSPALTPIQSDTTYAVNFSNAHNASASHIYTAATGTLSAQTAVVVDPTGNNSNKYTFTGGATTAQLASWVGTLMGCPVDNAVYPQLTFGGSLGVRHIFGNPNATNSMPSGYIEFNTDATLLEVAAVMADGINALRVKVDGVELSPSVFSTRYNSGSGSLYASLSITGPLRTRNIKIWGIGDIRQVAINGNAELENVPQDPFSIIAIGDSFYAGDLNQNGAFLQMRWPQYIAAEMGSDAVCNFSVGGTGIESNASGYNWVDRVNETTRTNIAPVNSVALNRKQYNVVLFEIGHGNDTPPYSTLQPKTVALLQTLRTMQPDAFFICTNQYGGSTESSYQQMTAVAKAVFAQWNDPKSILINTDGTDGARWITGNNYCLAGNVAATGNSSLMIGADGVHQLDNALMYLGQKVVQSVSDQLNIVATY